MKTRLDVGNNIFKGKFKIVGVYPNSRLDLKCNKCGRVFRHIDRKPKCCRDSLLTKLLNLFRW